jgi:sugar phosphate isomerase/epimerase
MSSHTKSSFASIKIICATGSLGLISRPSPSLREKLDAISSAGFAGIELAFPDLLGFANDLAKKEVSEDDYDILCDAAQHVRKLCSEANLDIVVLQPFGNFEGWPEGSAERTNAFKRAKGWIRIMKAVGTSMLQVGSSDSEGIITSREELARDLGQLADLLAEEGFRLAYENWCWSTHSSTWKAAWELVRKANRSNIGLCLDTFQIAGSELADPTTKSGYIDNPNMSLQQIRHTLTQSLEELSREIPLQYIYYTQISDGFKPDFPLENEKAEGLFPRARWSHFYRPLPYHGGYLPVAEVTRAFLKTGYRGWFSAEVFDGGCDGKGDGHTNIHEYAKQAMRSCQKLFNECDD